MYFKENFKYLSVCKRHKIKSHKFKCLGFFVGGSTNDVTEGHIVLIAPRPPLKKRGGGSQNDDPKSRFNPLYTAQAEGGPNGEGMEMIKPNRVATSPEPDSWQHEKCEGAGEKLSENGWGTGPYLTNDEAKEISGCCCFDDFCKFPSHPTAFQFFTPPMFTAYHREGYRACMECNDFLGVTET